MVPPRRPRLESVKTTIALQDKQIRMLTDRCLELQEERNSALDRANIADGLRKDATKLVEKLEAVIQRMTGWQDLARELLHHSTGE